MQTSETSSHSILINDTLAVAPLDRFTLSPLMSSGRMLSIVKIGGKKYCVPDNNNWSGTINAEICNNRIINVDVENPSFAICFSLY